MNFKRDCLMLLSVSVSIFSVIVSGASTSTSVDVLDVVQAGKHTATPEHERNNDMDKYNRLTTDSTVTDVVNNPAFKGFGLGTDTNADGWIDGAVKFWEKHINTSDKNKMI